MVLRKVLGGSGGPVTIENEMESNSIYYLRGFRAKGQGGLASRLIMGIAVVIVWLVGVLTFQVTSGESFGIWGL